MGLLDDAKVKLGAAVEKAKVVAEEHADQIDDGIDKLAGFVDQRTGGRHTPKIDKAADQARKLVEKLDKGQDGKSSN